MSRRPPTPDQLESLRETFRKQPPSTPRDFKAAGVRAGVTEAAARRAYTRGWPGIESIQAQLDAERARQQQSAEYLKAERMNEVFKTNAAILQGEMRRLFPAFKALTDNLLDSLQDIALMPTDRAVKTMLRVVKVYRDAAAVHAKSIEIDRLLAGEATSIVGHKQIEPEAVDLEKAQAVSEQLARALRRAGATQSAAEPVPATKDTPDVDTSVN